MENKTDNKASDFIKGELLKLEKKSFTVHIIATTICYIGITFWLNAIRTTAPLWFVWALIIIQFALYFSIFIVSYRRSVVCGLNKNISILIFTILAILGRINDWELAIIPLTIIVMLIFSMKAKNVSNSKKHLLPKRPN